MGQNGSKKVKIGNFAKIHENELESGAPASLLPSFPISGHANGAKWVKMGQNSSKWVKTAENGLISLKPTKMHFNMNFWNFLAMLMGQNGAKWVKTAQKG